MSAEELAQEFVVTFVGIAGGIIGGAYASLRIQQKMKSDSEKGVVKNMIESIKEELDDAKKGIGAFKKDPVKWDKSNGEFKGEKPWILKPAYESAVNSGNFVLLNKTLQKDIPKAYLSIDAINFYSDLIRRFVFSSGGIKRVDFTADDLCIKLEKNVKKLDDKFSELLPKLKVEVN